MDLIELIASFEGFREKAYKCPAGVWTIGYGSTYYEDGTRVKEGDTITKAKAMELLRDMVLNFKAGVIKLVPPTLPSKSIDALTSFAYNCGIAALTKSTLLKKIKADKNDIEGITAEFMKWNKANGKVLSGLTKRRKIEADWYKDGILSQYTKNEIYEMYKCNYK